MKHQTFESWRRQQLGLDTYMAKPKKGYVSEPISLRQILIALLIIMAAIIFMIIATDQKMPNFLAPFNMTTN